mgnify:CR=1 FL=1|jgi:hypothetical protein
MNYEKINKPIRYKSIWLSTTDAVASSDRKKFTFNNLPIIQTRGKSYLKINSITLSGAGIASAPNNNWEIKLSNVKFNGTNYFNSDKNSIPTIACINYDTNNSIQNGKFSLELTHQDITQPVIHIKADDGFGAVKSGNNIDFHIGLCIEEYDE